MVKELEKRLMTSLILIPVSIFFISKGSIFFIFFLSILFLAASYEWILMTKKNNLFRLLGIIFLFFSFYSAHEFRENENYKDFLFIITICIFTDIGGYIFGKIFKGPKLTKISPKKTYAGVFGSFFLPFIVGLVIYEYLYTVQIPSKGTYFLTIVLLISLILISKISSKCSKIVLFFEFNSISHIFNFLTRICFKIKSVFSNF